MASYETMHLLTKFDAKPNKFRLYVIKNLRQSILFCLNIIFSSKVNL